MRRCPEITRGDEESKRQPKQPKQQPEALRSPQKLMMESSTEMRCLFGRVWKKPGGEKVTERMSVEVLTDALTQQKKKNVFLF